MRDTTINLRAQAEQRELIDYAAQLLGKSRSAFILEAACDKAWSVVQDQVLFNLDENKFHQFTQLLDAPLTSTPGVERLMAVKPLWSTSSE